MSAAELRAGPVADAIRSSRLVVVLRRIEPRDRLLALVDELADAGARIFEITFDGPTAAADVVAVRERLARRGRGRGHYGFLVGAGTLVDESHLRAAMAAGAAFGVAPILQLAHVASAIAAGLPFISGALTPTEIAAAWDAGATFVKLFPSSSVGPSFVRELRGPMPDVELIPTGGVDGRNAEAWLDAGAAAVGIGSALTKADAEARRELVARIAAR